MPTSRRGPDPVFVDRTGRRRRLFAIAGATGGLVLVLVAAALLAGFTGDGPATVPGWPTGGKPARTTITTRPAAPGPDTAEARPSAQSTVPVPVAAPSPRTTTATPAPTGTATRTPGSRRRNPSHTPAPHPTKTH